jgi:glycosyltransferase involved in cell wall biosynthesis
MHKKFKLLSIIETLGKGGAERVLVNTLPELQKLGIDCEVAVLFKKDDLAKELESQGIKVHILDLSYKWNILEGTYKLLKLIKKEQYNIVHAHLFFAYFYTALVKALYWRIKTVVTFHNLSFDEYPANTILKKLRKKLDCFILNKLFNKMTAVSIAVQNHFQNNCYLKNIDVIHNSFPIKSFNIYKIDKSILLDKYEKNNDFIILTPGRFVEKKGHIYLIEAINILNKKYSNLTFLFVGKGPLEKKLQQNAPLNLKFIPEMPHTELMKLYNQVDMIVIPSIYEAFGLVVGEAMIMEKPIVATKVDGIVEMIDHNKEGILVSPKDSIALAEAIDKLYQNREIQEKLVQNASVKIKQFDTKIIAKQWKEYYEKVLND